ncbi:MAG: bacterioferritin [Deltaproteobacteria bacterium]|nr:bacterioferritin [Deltaproteobacteria bacterium]
MTRRPPKGGTEVVTALNDLLTGELTAINQYFLHAKLCKNWGFTKLAAKIHAESIDEMKHADALIERILYLDGLPNVQRLGRIRVGETVREAMEADLSVEYDAIPKLRDTIALCTATGDHGTRLLVERILEAEEEHLDWLETQLRLMDNVGDDVYLAEQI